MTGSIRVVLDTNVLYRQFSRYLLLSLSLQGVLLPVWSPPILDELTEVLLRHGFDPENELRSELRYVTVAGTV